MQKDLKNLENSYKYHSTRRGFIFKICGAEYNDEE